MDQGGMGNGVKGRFAPSPSGRMHLGNLFSALLVWLSARAEGGEVVLRVEDLDPYRSREAYALQLMDDLRWLELDWDEGPGQGGPHGPYFQSRRSDFYAAALEQLREKDLLYPCFCTREELHAAQAPHRADGQAVYDGRCWRLSAEEIARREQKRAPALRLRVPEEMVSFQDGHYGLYEENLARDCGDFILRRSDGVYAYQLAVVVDDALMGVTQVVRGRDLLGSTPRQIYLGRMLGLTPPAFSHLPLLVAPDGRRLSKRERDLDLGALRERGASPQAILGWLAWAGGLLDRPQPARARELLPLFSWEKVPREDIVVAPGIEKAF